MRIVCLLAPLGMALLACGEDAETADLSGSLGTIYGLEHTNTRTQRSGDTMSIEFRNRDGAVVTLSFDIEDVNAAGAYTIPTPVAVSFPQYANPNYDLSATGGQLVLERYPTDSDNRISGRFEASVEKASLVSEESEQRSYSVTGQFDTTLASP
ncbi:MAG: hypothetical protein VX589_18410 [Myxococcota bacterium]|nr:hypothetical protein [Myxococcota bacterium]